MATTVTYKGQTLTTVDNETKVLETAGTWVEDDFTLTDVSGGGAGEWTTDGIATNAEPNGALTFGSGVTEIKANAFYGKTAITSAIGEAVTKIDKNAFRESGLQTCSFPQVTYIETEAFRESRLTNVTDAEFPALVTTQQATFGTMRYLQRVFLSHISNISNYLFDACSELLTAVLPNVDWVGVGQFRNCTKLTAVDLRGNITATGNYRKIQGNAFGGAQQFSLLILGRYDSIVTLDNISAFSNTPFASNGTGGTLYVPQSLLSQYTQATNWSTILGYANNQILPIEGSIYETQYADGTPIE